MYYPLQIPYLLDQEFQKNIIYKEYQFKELNDYCMCIWQMKSKYILDKTIYNYILPDACIDIVIDFTTKTICFAGFSKDTIPFELNHKIDYVGVRLKPSTFYYFYGIDADKVMDNPIPFHQIDNENKLNEIFNSDNTEERLRILKKYLLDKIKNTSNTKYIDIVNQLYENPKEQSVLNLACNFGYNKRHLYRLFKTYYGVSPKVLLNILRLHLCLTLILENDANLIDIANMCGFYDQAHFIKEIKKYTGFSPVKLLDNYK